MVLEPKPKDGCVTCPHVFDLHYETFGGQGGCAYFVDSPRDGKVFCECRGFTRRWKRGEADRGEGGE
jgi:hypothetical protein